MGDPESGGANNSDDIDVNVKYSMDPSKRRNHYMYLCKVCFPIYEDYFIIDHTSSRSMVFIVHYGYCGEQNTC